MNFWNKHWPGFLTIAIITLIVFGCQAINAAEPQVNASAELSVGLPTKMTDGSTIPAGAITGIQWFVSNATIPDTSTLTPVDITAVNTLSYRTSILNNSTLYFRAKVCVGKNRENCSGFGPQTTQLFKILIPGAPGTITINVTITLTATPIPDPIPETP